MTDNSSESSTSSNNTISSESNNEDNNFDLYQDIARSGFADMLWDQERNYLYKIAVEKVLGRILERRGLESLYFYDIGFGTGLLSMFMYNTIKDYVRRNNLPETQFFNKKIIGYETFEPTFNCANTILQNNSMNDIIHLFNEYSVRENLNLNEEEKGCFLVSEVFDTELIGESAIEIFNNAKQNLLQQNALSVPKKARIYCQLIENKWLSNGNLFKPADLQLSAKKLKFLFPPSINSCPGSTVQLNDLQLNCLKMNELKIISDVIIAFEFNFTNLENIKSRSKTLSFNIIKKPKFYSDVCIAFWWDLQMDDEDEIILSCAPYWARYDINYSMLSQPLTKEDISIFFDKSLASKQLPIEEKLRKLNDFYKNELANFKNKDANEHLNFMKNFERIRLSVPWRDHWMQAVYFLPSDYKFYKDESTNSFKILAYHDLYSFWFDHFNETKLNTEIKQPGCHCGYHLELSRTSLRLINDFHIRSLIGQEIEKIYLRPSLCYIPNVGKKKLFRKSIEVFVFGEFGYAAILAAKITPKSMVYVCEEFTKTTFIEQQFLTEGLKCKFEMLPNLSSFNKEVDLVIKEPCNDQSKLPWQDLNHFLTCYKIIVRKTSSLFLVDSIPSVIDIKVMPVCFDHLWKTRIPIKKIENYDIEAFHDLIEESVRIADSPIEMYSLYEYDGICLSKPATLAKIIVKTYKTHKSSNTVSFKFNCEQIREKLTKRFGENELEKGLSVFNQQLKDVCPFRRSFSNIAFVFWINYNYYLSTGPHLRPKYLELITWHHSFKQGVYFMPEFNKDTLATKKSFSINLNVDYDFTGNEGLFVVQHKEGE